MSTATIKHEKKSKQTTPKSSLPKGCKKAIKDKMAEKGISRDWMSKHLEII